MKNNKNLLKSLFTLFGFALFCAPAFGMENIKELGDTYNYNLDDDILEDLENLDLTTIKFSIEKKQKIYDDLIKEMWKYDVRNPKKDTYSNQYAINSIKKIIQEEGFDVNYHPKNGNPLLFFALDMEDLGFELVKIFCEIGANIKIRDYQGNTPLMLACKKSMPALKSTNNFSCIEFLINRGDFINNKNKFGQTPLGIIKDILSFMTYRGYFSQQLLSIIKLLLYNNAKFTEDDYKLAKCFRINEPFDQIISFKEDTKEDALQSAINNKNIQFTPDKWLIYALINNHVKQIRYYINNNNPALLASEIVINMIYKKNIPLTMFDSLWEITEDFNKKSLESWAYENKNQLFLNAITQHKLIKPEINKQWPDIKFFYKN